MNSITLVKRNASSCPLDWRWQSIEDIHEALRIAFGYLPYVTLSNCALVSKTWRKMALNELECRCAVTVQNDDQVRHVLQQVNKSSNPNFRVGKCSIVSHHVDSTLINQMCSRFQVTLNILKLETSYISQDSFYVIKLLANLPNLTHCSVLSICVASEINVHDETNLKKNDPNLSSGCSWVAPFSPSHGKTQQDSKDLYCSASVYSDIEKSSIFVHKNMRYLLFDAGQNARFLLSKLFHAFPSLVECSVANVIEESQKHFKCQCATLCHPQTLKRLTLRQYSNIGFPEKLVQQLLKLDICLEKLMLILHPPSQSSSKSLQASNALLKQFIESQGATLKSLKLVQVEDNVCDSDYCRHLNPVTCGSGNAAAIQNFHVNVATATQTRRNYHWNFNYSSPSFSLFPMILPNLEVLYVQKPLITNLAQVLKHFPTLRQLSIQVSPHGSNWKGMLPQQLEPHPEITAFKLDFIDLESLSRLVPCLTSLQTFQLAYCDETLFNVLCKRIPYFNGNIAKEKLISCQNCHQDGEPHRTKTEDLPAGKDVKEKSDLKSKTLFTFKNLKQLKIRPCHHFPYENFVFLKNGNSGQNVTVSSNGNYQHDGFIENDSFDSTAGFSWSDADILTEQEFVDLHINPSENTESCSSA